MCANSVPQVTESEFFLFWGAEYWLLFELCNFNNYGISMEIKAQQH